MSFHSNRTTPNEARQNHLDSWISGPWKGCFRVNLISILYSEFLHLFLPSHPFNSLHVRHKHMLFDSKIIPFNKKTKLATHYCHSKCHDKFFIQITSQLLKNFGSSTYFIYEPYSIFFIRVVVIDFVGYEQLLTFIFRRLLRLIIF